jgi:hypothetical protein
MPTLLRWRDYRFFFYSREHGEPPHVHIENGSGQAKIWLHDASIARSKGLAEHELRVLQAKVAEHQKNFVEA